MRFPRKRPDSPFHLVREVKERCLESRDVGESSFWKQDLFPDLACRSATRVVLGLDKERMKARGVHVLLCGVRSDFAEKIRRTGLAERIGEPIFLEQPVRQTSTMLAIRHAYELIPATCPPCPRSDPRSREQSLYYAI